MSANNAPAGGGPRVLVIDDEGVICLSSQRTLAASGFQVDCCQDPREGLRAGIAGNYDVILLDLMMPEMNGMEVFRQLKSAGVNSEVVIITGYSTVQTAV